MAMQTRKYLCVGISSENLSRYVGSGCSVIAETGSYISIQYDDAIVDSSTIDDVLAPMGYVFNANADLMLAPPYLTYGDTTVISVTTALSTTSAVLTPGHGVISVVFPLPGSVLLEPSWPIPTARTVVNVLIRQNQGIALIAAGVVSYAIVAIDSAGARTVLGTVTLIGSASIQQSSTTVSLAVPAGSSIAVEVTVPDQGAAPVAIALTSMVTLALV